MKGLLRVGTHDGSFHADEALAIWMLRRLHPDMTVTRSRDTATLAALDLLVDVGGVYDAARLRFDHHQRGFVETFSPRHRTTLSSAGLIYKHYGSDVLKTLSVKDDTLDSVYRHVYDQFVEGMDGSDNGIENSRGLYKERTDIGARVARLNKPWNFTGAYDSDAAFASAVDLCGSELSYFVKEAVEQWLPGRKIVEQGLAARLCEEVVVLSEFCPWADHLVELQGGGESKVFFVLYPDGKEYRIRAVPKAPDSFELLNPLREEWRGLRGEQLDAVSGVPGGVFVHANGFVGGHKTLEGAIEMAMRSLKLK